MLVACKLLVSGVTPALFRLNKTMTHSVPANEPNSDLPDFLPVAVIMERRPTASRWQSVSWSVVGVTVGPEPDPDRSPRVIRDEDGIRQVMYGGYRVRLHRDECESYYHNLRSPAPGCYVIARPGADEEPVPFQVSLSFDEANAYLEGEDTVFTAPIPAELYRWTERFVLMHYVPEKRKKRKRDDWKGARRG